MEDFSFAFFIVLSYLGSYLITSKTTSYLFFMAAISAFRSQSFVVGFDKLSQQQKDFRSSRAAVTLNQETRFFDSNKRLRKKEKEPSRNKSQLVQIINTIRCQKDSAPTERPNSTIIFIFYTYLASLE